MPMTPTTPQPIAFAAPSESHPGLSHIVAVCATGCCLTCTCPDFTFRHGGQPHTCKHIAKVRETYGAVLSAEPERRHTTTRA